MPTTTITQGIARILRGEVARANRNQTWFGQVIGRSQAHASQVLQGKKPLTTDELALACAEFGLTMSAVFAEAERMANSATTGVPSQDALLNAIDNQGK